MQDLVLMWFALVILEFLEQEVELVGSSLPLEWVMVEEAVLVALGAQGGLEFQNQYLDLIRWQEVVGGLESE